MNELVIRTGDDIFTDSLIFAEKLDLNHKDVLKDIRNLTATNSSIIPEFKITQWTNTRNRTYDKMVMSKKGFMSLMMNTNVSPQKKQLLYKIQNDFIDAFQKMEEIILKEQLQKENLEWSLSREQGKQIRLQTTDTIKEFVEYATVQGSDKASFYYKHFTKATYKALQFMQQAKPGLRDTLDLLQLHQLILAEDLCKRSIAKYMKQQLHYKEIYILVKLDIENFAKSLFLK